MVCKMADKLRGRAAAAAGEGRAVVYTLAEDPGKLIRSHGICGDTVAADDRIAGIGFAQQGTPDIPMFQAPVSIVQMIRNIRLF